jgi:hypothetical protein
MIERKRVIPGRTRWKGRELYLDMIERKKVIPDDRKEENYIWTR